MGNGIPAASGNKGANMKTITTERLVLKPMCTEYLISTHAYAADRENSKFMAYLPNDNIEETLEYLESAEAEFQKDSPEFYEMAVFYGDVHIGAVSLYLDESRTTCEFGWMLHRNYHGKGFATEAALAMLKYARDELGIRHFIATCDTENIPSRRVMEKLGMTLSEERGGRKNKLSDEERREYLYELCLN